MNKVIYYECDGEEYRFEYRMVDGVSVGLEKIREYHDCCLKEEFDNLEPQEYLMYSHELYVAIIHEFREYYPEVFVNFPSFDSMYKDYEYMNNTLL